MLACGLEGVVYVYFMIGLFTFKAAIIVSPPRPTYLRHAWTPAGVRSFFQRNSWSLLSNTSPRSFLTLIQRFAEVHYQYCYAGIIISSSRCVVGMTGLAYTINLPECFCVCGMSTLGSLYRNVMATKLRQRVDKCIMYLTYISVPLSMPISTDTGSSVHMA